MRIKMRSLKWLVENSTVLENGGVQYNAPVNFFEHVARCTDWKVIFDEARRVGGFDNLRICSMPDTLIDHYVFSKNVVVESLDPEFCGLHKLWKSRLWIGLESYGGSFVLVDLLGDHAQALKLRFTDRSASTLRTLAARVLADDPNIVVEGEPHLILGRYVAYRYTSCSTIPNYFQDRLIHRETSIGREKEREYRQKEREMR